MPDVTPTAQQDRRPAVAAPTIPMLIAGKWRAAEQFHEVRDPYRGDVVNRAPISSARDCEDALQAAHLARKTMAAMPAFERASLLRRVADGLGKRTQEIARVMTRETGKALRDSLVEVQRTVDLLQLCAEEAVRIQGEHVPLDASAVGAGKLALLMRHPVGVVGAITPFNSPVNLAVHKLGPAIAAGNSVVLKPSPKSPQSVHLLVEVFVDAGLPAGALNTIYGDAVAAQMVADRRVDFVSFTGSNKVGRIIRDAIGMKRVALELGGVGPTFVHRDADVAEAAKACARHAVGLAGQSCASVQNVFVHRQIHDSFLQAVAQEMDAIRFGDPMDLATDVGTLVDEQAAMRVEATVNRALEGGAQLVRGMKRKGAQLDGIIVSQVKPDMDLVCNEIFGPAMTVQPYEDLGPIFEAISDSPFGLQAGIYTNSLDTAMFAMKNLRTGGVIVNATSRWRTDQMPYGGVKESGIGREGAKFSIRDMTEERLFVLN